MENSHIKPGVKVPLHRRQEVYIKCKYLLENWEKLSFSQKRFLREPALCLLMPSVLWGLESFKDNPNGWEHEKAYKMFPELASFIKWANENEKEVNNFYRYKAVLRALKEV